MDTKFQFQYLPYSQTGKFTKIALDYVSSAPALKDFYGNQVSVEGIKSTISERKNFNTNRKILVDEFTRQYKDFENCDLIKANIEALSEENTFTICTAHQPNIFTGHLYFIYKILHTIKLADFLKNELPEYNFVPVFFMGSEDADVEELNHIELEGEKYVWETKQTGAFGRMKVDEALLKLIEKISGRLSVEKYGSHLIDLLKKCYTKNASIEEATFLFIHELFKEFGLLILLPDNAAFKKEMISVFEEDIFNHTSSEIVSKSSEKLAENYKAQAYPREINLFYLKDNLRNRIVPVGDHFVVHDTDIVFSKEEMKAELQQHPERFSPNVILRGLFQEIILPDVAWIGGGGELAYWLQLNELFKNYKVPFPVLILRNSFLIVEEKYERLLQKLNLKTIDLFKGEENILNGIVNKETSSILNLDKQKKEFDKIYNEIKSIVSFIDTTLEEHTKALETKQMKRLAALEKKMLRAEKRKFSDQKNQLNKIFAGLFPGDGLQERTENFMLFYSRMGNDFFKLLYDASLTLEQEFCIIERRGEEEPE
ncbi:MAG: bacillithiol biosynthesis cysteine-adding enzyme BshC [Bacteroidota bacterium]|nr:bacillithiol biosynthesis cysteine-adding enzyme BshC [Bacteroidota bacterium]